MLRPLHFLFMQGCIMQAYRNPINASDKLVYTLVAASDTGWAELVPMTLTESFNAVGWSAQSEPPGALPIPLYSSNSWFIEVNLTGTHIPLILRVRLPYRQKIRSSSSTFFYTLQGIKADVDQHNFSPRCYFRYCRVPVAGTNYVLNIDTSVTMPAGYGKLFLITSITLVRASVWHSNN